MADESTGLDRSDLILPIGYVWTRSWDDDEDETAVVHPETVRWVRGTFFLCDS
ncbi:hypothetical protein DACRYDRAFT_24000 [Dacryopinax primogenitus]|uniref:Uncharacterized protein n=1 Tax=Dacryopinax primogenitus (strain DJM 731) TaxID=1858805 RepID=M5G542_DACPD|nr:uncharacterized protein DACRYDRAFT_24000 [Dacryopinax primogenitus]EJT98872.1 hypothetical protein DACRYDRAFT_24000 [Dacryopinax primogenitus]